MTQVSTLPRYDVCETLTGTYTGNGVDNRNINVGVDLAAKSNVTVTIKSTGDQAAVFRIEYAQGDLTAYYIGGADAANKIQSFTATGFQVGTNTEVNINTTLYRYSITWTER
jgi:hypothetical protein